MQNKNVLIYVWLPEGRFCHGHAAIEIHHNGEEEYISVYPSPDSSGIYSVDPILRTKAEDEENQSVVPTIYSCSVLNTEKMMTLAKKMRTDMAEVRLSAEELIQLDEARRSGSLRIPERAWSFGLSRKKNTLVCSEFIFLLLEEGGLSALIPYYANITDVRLLCLLSVRPTIALALNAPVFYYFLTKAHSHTAVTFAHGVCSFFLQLVAASVAEWSCLANTRKLVELCGAHVLVRVVSLFGLGVGGLFFTCMLSPWTKGLHSVASFFADFALWFGCSGIGFLVSGVAAGMLAYSTWGLRVYIRPMGLKYLLDYLKDIHTVTAEERNLHFQQEFSQLLMLFLAMVGSFAFWREEPNPLIGSILGSGVFAAVGCVGTCALNQWIDQRIRGRSVSPLALENARVKSHKANPVQFFIVAYFVSAGIVASLSLTQALFSENLFLMSGVSVVAAFFSYCLGVFVEKAASSCTTGVKSISSGLASRFRFLGSGERESEAVEYVALADWTGSPSQT